jgi:alpha-1,3-mannosyltransferase
VLSVVHICTDFYPSTGGIEQFVGELAQRSAANGVRVTVVCFNRTRVAPGRLPADTCMNAVAVKRIPFFDLRYYKPCIIPLSIIRSHDIVHVHGIGAPLDYLALMKFLHGRPIVMSTHGGIFHTPAMGRLKRLYFRHVARLALDRVNVVAACSESDASLFRAISDRVTLLENAVDVEPYLALPGARKVPGRCLYVGRLSANKGIDLLLRAAASAQRRGGQFSLRLVGPDVEGKRGEYETIASSLGISDRVTFVGTVSGQSLLEEFDLAENFVSASLYEGFGISAIEARAAGCRLILHDNEAFRCLFKSDSAVTLLDFTNTEIAGAAFANLLNASPQPTIGETRRWVEKFSWSRKIQEWMDVYQRIILCD